MAHTRSCRGRLQIMAAVQAQKEAEPSYVPQVTPDGSKLKLLGLTGGVGMGKSVAAGLLAGLGLPVVDTDLLARDLVCPGQPALAEIQSAFGHSVVAPDGHLQREVLARIVFSDALQRRQLEDILHPRIRAAWKERVRAWEGAGERAGVVVIPLLFETGAETAFAATICVACSAASQAERLAARGWSAADSAQRIRAQWPVERKLALADFLVWAEGGLERTKQQLERILHSLGLAAAGVPEVSAPATRPGLAHL